MDETGGAPQRPAQALDPIAHQSPDRIDIPAHHPATPSALVRFMAEGWADSPAFPDRRHPAADRFAERRKLVASALQGRTLVVPSGHAKIRSNDTDYRFRPGTDFFWLCGHDEPDGVLIIDALTEPGRATLYVEPRADRSTPAFFTDPRNGELWVGPRRGVPETERFLGVPCAPLGQLAADLAERDDAAMVTLRGLDPAVDEAVAPHPDDERLAITLSELRLVKDPYEIRMLEAAVGATVHGFEDVVRALPEAMEQGERVLEGVFNLRARVEGNDVGYGTIAASGAHATILHWVRNDGEVRRGDLLLLDAGVECHELYTADVTRTLPVSGRFTAAQRELYELVLAAQRAGIAAVRPGADFADPHRAAMAVLAEGLARIGVLPQHSGDEEDPQLYRRYTLHGTSHMLGLDVHDCAHARDEEYRGGTLQPGYVLTVEPGLYFQSNDLTVPEHLRGIGIRIEDDVLVTDDGCRVLSAALPTEPDEIERWMAGLAGSSGLRAAGQP
ncbi:MAG: aminopeptidase P family protein [Candidatus Dormibacteria bacterium]